MKIIATPIIAKDLKPGDLFSTVGPEYWLNAMKYGPYGERVYIRTNVPADTAPDGDMEVYLITIQKDGP